MNMSVIYSLICSYQKGCEFRGAVSSSRHRAARAGNGTAGDWPSAAASAKSGRWTCQEPVPMGALRASDFLAEI